MCGQQGELFFQHYQHCHKCDLIAAHPDQHLSHTDEKAQYDLHQNSPDDLAYRDFLNQLLEPVCKLMPPPAKVLDFGSGPGPTVSVMLEERGYEVKNYDPIYALDDSCLFNQYDLITMTEVFEHVHKPLLEFNRLVGMLRTGGLLGIMTALHQGSEKFPNWHYKNDPTHVCFFSQQTMRWLAKQCDIKMVKQTGRITIYSKN